MKMFSDSLCSGLTAAALLFAIILVPGLTSCSTNQAYSSFQAAQRNSCYSVPSENYDACMAEANKSFDEYEQELKDVERTMKAEKKEATSNKN